MNRKSYRLLLVNPWIVDFAAYDLWAKPLGLLRLAALLRQCGYAVELVDCLDRHHPLLDDWETDRPHERSDGSGKFIRQIIAKPQCLRPIPRHFCRYGLPLELVESYLQRLPQPDAILLTSMMTYWYPAVSEMAQILRRHFPHTPLVLGGIYATLCPEHARTTVRPDILIQGEGERQLPQLLHRLFGVSLVSVPDFAALPFPAYDLYSNLDAVAIETSRGCPFACSFCATHLLVPEFRRRAPQRVVDELFHWSETAGIQHAAFYDDALLVQPESSIKPILRLLIECESRLCLHLPNGIHPRQIDKELADLFFAAGVKTIRLSFESASPARQDDISHKVAPADLENALNVLERAGYERRQIGVYVLLGLPGQPPQEVRESCLLVRELGARVDAASFSPIPGTRSWNQAVKNREWDPTSDLLLSNNSIFPLWRNRYGYEFCREFWAWIKTLNREPANPDDRLFSGCRSTSTH
ncbi:B12-binding domain-containing radical SAM protein [candidate division KSB1 bacterium]|nr:B12-binding domain-containing radical SAM protein [candidate division KSB1 bacterium]